MAEDLTRQLQNLNLDDQVTSYDLKSSTVLSGNTKDRWKFFASTKTMIARMFRAGDDVALFARELVIPGTIFPSSNIPDSEIHCSGSLLEFFGLDSSSKVALKRVDSRTTASSVKIISELVDKQNLEPIIGILADCPFIPTPLWKIPNFNGLGPVKMVASCGMASAEFAKINFETSMKLKEMTPSSTDLDGSSEAMVALRKFISTCLYQERDFQKYLVKPPKGILLHGPPGTGKTSSVISCASSLNVPLLLIDGAELASKYYGDSEKKIRSIFHSAALEAPSIVFIDEIDVLCPKRSSSASSSETRVLTTLLTLLDGLETSSHSPVAIVAATNQPNDLDPALRRPGRFDKELEFNPPTPDIRLSLLRSALQSVANSTTSETLNMIASNSHGYVPADIQLLVKEAITEMLQRDPSSSIVSDDDLLKAFAKIKPNVTRESQLELSRVSWDDIAGNSEAKVKLKESVEMPLRFPEKFESLGLKPPKGILLYGPPGCSKTLLAKALASESKLNFFAVKGPELLSKWVGDSEKAIRGLFAKARLAAPSIIFFDEFDAIGSKRQSGSSNSVGDRVVSQILCELDGIDALNSVTVIAATNRPDSIDPALLRPGRFDRHIYIPLPDAEAREKLFKLRSKSTPVCSDVDFRILANSTEGYSGAEIVHIFQEAAYLALRKRASLVTTADFELVLQNSRPRITQNELFYFENMQRNK